MTTIRDGQHVCGFCSTNHHGLCPGAVRNGNGDLIRCPCREQLRCGMLRCLDCGWRRPEDVNAQTWTCWDPEDCQARRKAKMEANPAIIQIRQIRAEQEAAREASGGTSEDTEGRTRPRGPRVTTGATRATSGTCRCCGEPTRGGNFLPGHDSRYLSQLVEQFKNPTAEQDPAHARRAAASISPAFLAKFDKRAGVLQ